ncbi:hypothetical protein [Telluribacter sp. SYSU D00476]|uniref:hypothetical protein n=1 Tax=Telluribacter sp. SYSU D00476 TaxID=2811430 RepID=UPI001FF1A8BC|nr:hypothetical protein [Telluribacter sp. SYSU D00476]
MIRIPTRAHGIMDMVYSAALMAAPVVLKAVTDGRLKNQGTANKLLPTIGAGILAQGLMTNHETGAVKAIDMKTHMAMDLGVSALMMAVPYIAKLDNRIKYPMIALGVIGIGLALMTKTKPSYEQAPTEEPDTFLEHVEKEATK